MEERSINNLKGITTFSILVNKLSCDERGNGRYYGGREGGREGGN